VGNPTISAIAVIKGVTFVVCYLQNRATDSKPPPLFPESDSDDDADWLS